LPKALRRKPAQPTQFGILEPRYPRYVDSVSGRRRPLAMADTAMLFKTATKQMAAKARLSATFMAKIEDQLSGSSGHIHQSLVECASGRPAFYDRAQPLSMTPVFRHFLAGQLDVFRPATHATRLS
jgi:glutamine synthetase